MESKFKVKTPTKEETRRRKQIKAFIKKHGIQGETLAKYTKMPKTSLWSVLSNDPRYKMNQKRFEDITDSIRNYLSDISKELGEIK